MQTPRITGGIAADEPYWEGLERGIFQLSRCASCRRWLWPAHFRCEHCGSWEIDWIPLDPVGSLYTFSRVFYTPGEVRERAADVPYVAVLVEIPKGAGARVSGVLAGSDEGLAIGASLRGVFRPGEPRSKGYATIAWEIVR